MVYILHLSDLHFGTSSDADRWYGQLYIDLKVELNCSRLDALILSGDIANFATQEEYRAAEQFLNQLCINFQLTPSRLIIVPGNHDVNWAIADQALAYDNGQPKLDKSKHRQRFDPFRNFSRTRKHESYPLDYEYQGILYPLRNQKLLILGLNSAWKLDKHETKAADINPDAIDNALRKFFENQEQYQDWLKLAVWHHPLNSSEEDRIKDHGFMQKLAVAGFRLALHGHIHKAETSLFRYDMSPGGRKLDLVSAGTFGAPTKELPSAYPWQYNLLELTTNKLTVRTRRREEKNGTWKPDARWTQGARAESVSWYELPVEYTEPSRPRLRSRLKKKVIPDTPLEHFQKLADEIAKGRVIPFLGADINLCSRRRNDFGELESWRSEDGKFRYPPSSSELASHLDAISGFKFSQAVRCPLWNRDFEELPPGCPAKAILEGHSKWTRMDLSQVSEYVQLTSPLILTDELENLFRIEHSPNRLHHFFANLPALLKKIGSSLPYPLIVTTCFDNTLEIAFKEAKQPFALIYFAIEERQPTFKWQRFVLRKLPEGKEGIVEEGEATTIKNADMNVDISLSKYPAILKLYGDIGDGQDFIMTEDHFIDYLAHQNIAQQLPQELRTALESRHNRIWFLGYSLSYWNLRVIMHRIWPERIFKAKGKLWWSIQSYPEILDEQLWNNFGGQLINVKSWDDYVIKLEEQLNKKVKRSVEVSHE